MNRHVAPWLQRWLRDADVWAARPAVLSQGRQLLHGEWLQAAAEVADRLIQQGVAPGDRVGLMGTRTVEDFIHLMGIWLAGAAYVPLNPRFPAERLSEMARRAGLKGLLAGLGRGVEQRLAELADFDGAARIGAWVPAQARLVSGPADPGLAYIIFTSGTTGQPKGVPIRFDNLAAYVATMSRLFPVGPDDVVLQSSELSFDLSVLEVIVSLRQGAALCVVPANATLMAGRYAREHGVTVWVSVPSTVSLATRARALAPGSLPELRLAFFCGEALTAGTVGDIHAAAPKARVVNLWGPTEATVSFTYHEVALHKPLAEVTPIGWPHPDQSLALWDKQLTAVAAGELGELVQAGSQVCQGYWRDEARTAERFVDRDGVRWYRTGDLARLDPELGYLYAGRLDRQVKVKGYRIELQECESVLRRVSGREFVCVVPEPEHQPQRLVACLQGEAVPTEEWTDQMSHILPIYMLPERWAFLATFPFNDNGKIDTKRLAALVRDPGAASPGGTAVRAHP